MRKLNRSGLTLIEIIISLAILGIIAVSLLTIFSSSFKFIFNAGRKSVATYGAQQNIEQVIAYDNSGNSGTLTLSFSGAGLSSHTANVNGATISDPQNILTTFLTSDQSIVVDVIPPVITLNGNSTINLNQGQTYTDPGATAIDNVDGNITHKIAIDGNTALLTNSAELEANTYILTYNVSDSSGNAADTVTRTVNINPIIYYGNIKGNVKENVHPFNNISGVTVSVYNGATFITSGSTSSNGNYTINNVSTGTYTIRFNKTGYQTLDKTNQVIGDGQTITVDAQLIMN
jgi:prepilin-type N-terminal cleavage/methylation domain-containing protein